jgi:hypothetical protein
MTTLNLSDHPVFSDKAAEEGKPGFWRRQFQQEATPGQRHYDWLFGVVMPAVCFALDPVIFRSGINAKGAFLGTYKPFAYLLSFALIMTMSAWLLWGKKLKVFNGLLSGLFALGGLIALVIGIVIFPLSVLGLLLLIGLLGFVPLFTSVVYLRTAVRAFRSAKPFLTANALTGAFVLGLALSFTVPMLVNLKIYRSLEAMKTSDVAAIRANARELRYVAPLVDAGSLAAIYCHSSKDEKYRALVEAYADLTGYRMERPDSAICNDW